MVQSLKTVTFPVMESFYTIQGEGVQVGRAAWFVRLGGCDVGCIWCDVKESWDAAAHPQFTPQELVSEALKQSARFVVITGGEPAMYNLEPLTEALKSAGFEIAIETSGAYPLQGNFDWICVSPKKFKAPLTATLAEADELKVVIYNKSDFDWAEKHAGSADKNCVLLLQPEYSRFNEMMPLIVDYVKLYPQWRISLQTHKIIGIP
jgi:organic radical activating enzyme